jgi:membrane protease YdiL (CAAX protease family)
MSRTVMDTNPVQPGEREADSQSDAEARAQLSVSARAAEDNLRAGTGNADNEASASPARPAATQRETALSPLAEVFLGYQGLYPGARWVVYLAMCFITLGILNFLTGGLRPEPVPIWWRMVTEASMMLAVILPGFVMARMERCSFGDFGLPAKRAFGRDFWAGALWGIGSLTLLMLMLVAVRAYSFGSLGLHGLRIFKFASYYAIFFLFTGVFEDFLMRGYSQWVLAQGMHFWPAAAMLSVIFGLLHLLNAGEAKTGIAAVVVIGFFFCLTLRRTGTLWFAVGFHMAWDWGESFLYSVPDSGTMVPGHLLKSSLQGPAWLTGGSVGPEASCLLFVLVAGLWFLFSRAYPEVKYQVARNGKAGVSAAPSPGLLES